MSMSHASVLGGGGGATVYSIDLDGDMPDELKATVVMEAIMTASDVAHNLQGFEQMEKWSNRLYLELRKAYVEKRGVDCSPKVCTAVYEVRVGKAMKRMKAESNSMFPYHIHIVV
jgi:hypothetical protein